MQAFKPVRKGFFVRHLRLARYLVLALAALPVFQISTGCFPDLVSALNWELQSSVNNVLLTAISTIIQNILNL